MRNVARFQYCRCCVKALCTALGAVVVASASGCYSLACGPLYAVCAPYEAAAWGVAATVVVIDAHYRDNHNRTRADPPPPSARDIYIERMFWIGKISATELSPAGEINLDERSIAVNYAGHSNATLAVILDEETPLREWLIEIDVEADCAAETLYAERARSYTGPGEDLVAFKSTPTGPIEGLHPTLGASLKRLCQTTTGEAHGPSSEPRAQSAG
jgi:hypothetical protein